MKIKDKIIKLEQLNFGAFLMFIVSALLTFTLAVVSVSNHQYWCFAVVVVCLCWGAWIKVESNLHKLRQEVIEEMHKRAEDCIRKIRGSKK